jgi:imidazole glycerol-phosphate synthase subunit HisH
VKPVVTLIDYGIGNLFSVTRAFEVCGAEVQLADSASALKSAQRVVLPGVGAFSDGMRGLEERHLVGALREYASSGRPLLGICLGMQLLLSASEEFGEHKGLGIVPGRVVPVDARQPDGASRKIPHIGWSEIVPGPARGSWQGSILDGLQSGTAMYFVHSFTASPDDDALRLADCDYEGTRVCAALQAGNVTACQFHPERSGVRGLQVIRNFIACS